MTSATSAGVSFVGLARRFADLVSHQVGLNQRTQAFIRIDKLNRVGVLIQPPSGNGFFITGNNSDRTVDGQNRGSRIN